MKRVKPAPAAPAATNVGLNVQIIDLSFLTAEERERITAVLEKDAEIRLKEQERVGAIKKEMRQLRMSGVIRGTAQEDPMQSCARCREKFRWLINKPLICIQCSHRVCRKCTQPLPNKRFICVGCIKQMELEAMTGQWFYTLSAHKRRDRRTNQIVSGAEIVRASIRTAKPPPRDDVDGIDGSGSDTSSSIPSVSVTGPTGTLDKNSVDDAEETEDIGEMFAAYGAGSRKANSHSNLSRLSPFSSSKESIASVYSNAGEKNFGKYPVTGDIEFGLAYNYKQNSLEINIKRCRDLAAVDTKKNLSDPYVKTYLLPERTKNSKRKTRVRKHTLNPVFDEVLKYHVTKSALESRTLCLMVWNNDRFGRNDFLGEVNISFDHHTFDDPSPKWYKLQDRNLSPMSMLTYKGDLNLCLKYSTAEHLNAKRQAVSGGTSTTKECGGELLVLVKQARNLTAGKSSELLDSFCKCFLLPDRSRAGTQKSPVIKRSCNPLWNHTFVFDEVSWMELRERSVELTIWDNDRLIGHEFVGGVRLSLGTGKDGSGQTVDWMDSKGEEISLWQAMLDRPNCWIEGTLLLRPHMNTRK